MPGYVNIGARVGAGTMVDTWATVGSCAQIGSDCHLAGGVGIGGVLEPASAQPVIVEDGVFVGSRVVIVEGMHIGREAVIGAGVVLTSTTVILDVTGPQPVEHRGRVPARSVVIPGSRPKKFPAGEFGVPVRAHHRSAKRQHRPQGQPQRGPARLRGAGVSDGVGPEIRRRPRMRTLLEESSAPSRRPSAKNELSATQSRPASRSSTWPVRSAGMETPSSSPSRAAAVRASRWSVTSIR